MFTRIETVIGGRKRSRLVVGLLALLILTGIAAAGYAIARPGSGTATFPQSAAMEQQLGVRISRVAVVGDGGLITVNYVVLDSEKASRFQTDLAHSPVLVSDRRPGGTSRLSVMKQGHSLRAGQTYYLVYENTRGAVRKGETITITRGELSLRHVPVL
jgi:hypothetical protein